MGRYCISTISVAEWSGEVVVFHHGSGDTYLLNGSFLTLFDYCLKQTSFNSTDLMNQSQQVALPERKKLVNLFIQQLNHLNILQPINCEGK